MTETWLQATHLPRMRGVCTCSSRWVLIWCLLCFDLQIICRRRILIGIMYRARSGTHKSILWEGFLLHRSNFILPQCPSVITHHTTPHSFSLWQQTEISVVLRNVSGSHKCHMGPWIDFQAFRPQSYTVSVVVNHVQCALTDHDVKYLGLSLQYFSIEHNNKPFQSDSDQRMTKCWFAWKWRKERSYPQDLWRLTAKF